jgi:hypothetical protein
MVYLFNDDVLEEFAPCGDHSKSNGEKWMSTGNLQMMTAFIVKDSRYEASVAILSFTNMQSLQRTSKRLDWCKHSSMQHTRPSMSGSQQTTEPISLTLIPKKYSAIAPRSCTPTAAKIAIHQCESSNSIHSGKTSTTREFQCVQTRRPTSGTRGEARSSGTIGLRYFMSQSLGRKENA